ncbi:MAG: group II truncated hemoglobin [Brachymonas sp.]|jgi:hemoglobin
MSEITEKMPYPTMFEWVGGEAKIQALVDKFYDLMDLEPQYAHLRSLHRPDLQHSRDTLFWFLCGWTGGPRHYEDRFGHPRLRMRHLHVDIGIRERDDWMACMDQAMQECAFDPVLQVRLHEAFMHTADFMRNQNGH